MKPIVFDAETNILNKTIGKMKASPFYPDNNIVLGCFKDGSIYSLISTGKSSTKQQRDMARVTVTRVLKEYDMLVGHNIKFDLLYLRKNYNELYLDWVRRGGSVWDTQIVEYLITGQTHTYPKLDDLSVKYGGELKDDKIKEYWNNGIDTDDIPIEELLPYLKGDVDNTTIVFEEQVEEIMNEGMIPLVTAQMDALLALVEMEYNGIHFDTDKALADGEVISKQADDIAEDITILMKSLLPSDMIAKVTPASSAQLSSIFFGGVIKCMVHEEMVGVDGKPLLFKSGMKKGEVRTKKKEYDVELAGLLHTTLSAGQGESGKWSTNDKTIINIVKWAKSGISSTLFLSSEQQKALEIADMMLEWRKLSKDYNTYYVGLLSLVFPDGNIHPNYNQCATATGRLSSSSPNAQNMSGKKDDD